MIGFVIAGASVAGLLLLSRHSGRRRFGRRGLYWALRRLDTSPGQERVIRNAVDELLERGRAFRQQGPAVREELAQLLGGSKLEASALEAWLDRRIQEARAVFPEIAGELTKIHEVLDDRQRRELSRLVTRSTWYGRPACRG